MYQKVNRIQWYKTRLGAIMLRDMKSGQTYYIQDIGEAEEFCKTRRRNYNNVPVGYIYGSRDYEGYFDNLQDMLVYYGDTSDNWGLD